VCSYIAGCYTSLSARSVPGWYVVQFQDAVCRLPPCKRAWIQHTHPFCLQHIRVIFAPSSASIKHASTNRKKAIQDCRDGLGAHASCSFGGVSITVPGEGAIQPPRLT
jgi:hypothetical protein